MRSFLRNLHLTNRDGQSPASVFPSPVEAESQHIPSNCNILTQAHELPNIGNSLTVFELFQSQGCNSCPPTNANLLELTSSPTPTLSNAIFLTYHVTYWDHLGWRDTFGNSAFDNRQRDYVSGLGLRNAFTPQVIVNGRASGVGNTKRGLENVLKEGRAGHAPSVKIDVIKYSSTPDELTITVSMQDVAESSDNLDIAVVRYDPSTLNQSIRSGENKGKVLPHKNVVRSVERVHYVKEGQGLVFAINGESDRLETVILVQDGVGGPIVGAAKV